jgi:hypothetical protein
MSVINARTTHLPTCLGLFGNAIDLESIADVLHLLQAIEYFQRVIALQEDNGEVWSALGSLRHPVVRNPQV